MASTLEEMKTVKEIVAQRLAAHPRPIDPLEHLYTSIDAAIQQRLPVLEAIRLLAQRQDPQAQMLDHDPASWMVELRLHDQEQYVQVALDHRSAEDVDDDTITFVVDGTALTIRIL